MHNVMGTASVQRTAVAALLGDGGSHWVAEHSASFRSRKDMDIKGTASNVVWSCT